MRLADYLNCYLKFNIQPGFLLWNVIFQFYFFSSPLLPEEAEHSKTTLHVCFKLYH